MLRLPVFFDFLEVPPFQIRLAPHLRDREGGNTVNLGVRRGALHRINQGLSEGVCVFSVRREGAERVLGFNNINSSFNIVIACEINTSLLAKLGTEIFGNAEERKGSCPGRASTSLNKSGFLIV